MKITNFREYRKTGHSPSDFQYWAIVDVTTGCLWWRKTLPCAVVRGFAGLWDFVDTGESTPGWVVEQLERAYRFKNLVSPLW